MARSLLLSERRLLGDVKVVMSRRRAIESCTLSELKSIGTRVGKHTLALVTISTVLPSVTIITVILGVTLTVPAVLLACALLEDQTGNIPMVRAARAIPVTSALAVIVSVTVPTVVLARRIIASAAAGRRRASTSGRASATTSVTVASRFKAP
jgi:hypothetical protein